MAEILKAKHRPGYLRRWVLVDTAAGGLWLHRFEGADPRDGWHNHPRAFLSIVVRGPGYVEDYRRGGETPARRRVARWTVKRALVDWHRVVQVDRPTWTLLLLGPKRGRQWTTEAA